MGPTDEHDDNDHAQDMGTAADDDPIHVSDTKHEEEAKENDTEEEAGQTAQNVNARPVAHLREAGGEQHGTPKGRISTLVLSLPCCYRWCCVPCHVHAPAVKEGCSHLYKAAVQTYACAATSQQAGIVPVSLTATVRQILPFAASCGC